MTDDIDPDDHPKPDPETEVLRKQFDWATISPSTAIVETVSAASNSDALELGALYNAIDPDAVDTLCGEEAVARSNTISISFVFEEMGVTVRTDGRVTVYPDASTVEFD